MTPLATPLDRIASDYDVVVVGSGYGGGVTASRLARAGKRVLVLERGREYPTGSFPSRLTELRAELMVTGGRFGAGSRPGLYDFRFGEHIHVLTGCGLGGGSLVNAGVALRPDARVFADPSAFPAEIAGDGLIEEGFARAAAWIRPARDPEAGTTTKLAAFAKAGEATIGRPDPAPVAVSFADTVNPAGIGQPACTRCGDCCGGCNVGAKNTVALSYLPDAVAHGAVIATEARVTRLERIGSRWHVHVEPFPADPKAAGSSSGPMAVAADIVVLAAGTLGSTEILLRSRAAGLPLSARLGEGFSANGDIIAFGYNGRERVNAVGIGHPPRDGLDPVGASVTGQIEVADPADLDLGMCVQEGVLPSALGPLLPVSSCRAAVCSAPPMPSSRASMTARSPARIPSSSSATTARAAASC
ncbi:MAG: GMC family oxidoreductase N-terminal domain-containing protein [Hyphomicrobiaceae bacterium]